MPGAQTTNTTNTPPRVATNSEMPSGAALLRQAKTGAISMAFLVHYHTADEAVQGAEPGAVEVH
jgi:hypothetical protein